MMCGITGICYNNAMMDHKEIHIMNDAISHRGPDGEGFIAVNTNTRDVYELAGAKTPVVVMPITGFNIPSDMYLAHRRLSIVDLSKAGHQPMTNETRDLWIIYNGEIYNFHELREELQCYGYQFKSETDTEVLLYAYQQWGKSCLDKLNGMWSFVIYDLRKNELFGSRDHFGVKPFYYTQNRNFFAFSSEIKGLLANSAVSRHADTNSAAVYLRYGLDYFPESTFFSDIHELEPGHYFIYDLKDKKITIRKYFELKFNNAWEQYDENKKTVYITEIRERVIKAVEKRLFADVPIGSCLSGGMDSSAIVCSINNLLNHMKIDSIGSKQKVFTACYKDKPIDETKWAKKVVEKTGAEWYQVYPTQNELLTDLRDLINTQDVPFASTSIYAQYRVMKLAKENGVTVMLDGQGGDELFTGYTPFYDTFFKDILRNGDKTLFDNEMRHADNTPLGYLVSEELVRKGMGRDTLKGIIPGFVKPMLRDMMHSTNSKYIRAKGHLNKEHRYATVNQMLHTLMSYTSLPHLLKYEDRNSMRFAIESRTPFADDSDLIDYVFSISGSYKIHDGWSKYLLRESMTGIVPTEIKYRKDKIGFETPEYEWLKDMKPIVFDSIMPGLSSVMDVERLKKDWDTLFLRQKRNGVTDIWRFINYILWFDVFKVGVK